MKSSVDKYLRDKLERGEKIHLTLVDPDKASDSESVQRIAREMVEAGTDAFLIGGSTGVTPEEASKVAKLLKETGLPVIIFPGNVNCLTREADAVMFMALLNTLEPYYLFQVHVVAAPIVKKYGLETLPTGYLVVNDDTAVAHVGRIYPIPRHKPEIVAAYAMAAEMLGMRYLYIEAGSGSQYPVPPSFPAAAKKYTNMVVIVGGGIGSPETARELLEAGADAIVTGTLVEKDPEKAREIVRTVKHYR